MIRFLFDCVLWGLGSQPRSAETSSGFGSDQLIPTRERNGLEAATRILSSLLFLLAIIAQFLPEELSLLTAPQLHLLALASAVWGLQMILRPSVPMDSTAISTALWSFAGYFPSSFLGISHRSSTKIRRTCTHSSFRAAWSAGWWSTDSSGTSVAKSARNSPESEYWADLRSCD